MQSVKGKTARRQELEREFQYCPRETGYSIYVYIQYTGQCFHSHLFYFQKSLSVSVSRARYQFKTRLLHLQAPAAKKDAPRFYSLLVY